MMFTISDSDKESIQNFFFIFDGVLFCDVVSCHSNIILYLWRTVFCKCDLCWVSLYLNGPRQAKKSLRECADCADSHHPAHAQSLILPFCWILTLMFV